MTHKGQAMGDISLDYSNEEQISPHFRTVFSQPLTYKVIQMKRVRHNNLLRARICSASSYFQEASATILLPLLSEELTHMQLPGLLCRPRELKLRVTCGSAVSSF